MIVNKKIIFVLIAVLVLSISNLVLADEYIDGLKEKLESDPENVSLLKEIGIYYQELANYGDKKAVKIAMEYFEKAMKLDENDDSLKFENKLVREKDLERFLNDGWAMVQSVNSKILIRKKV